MLAINGFWVGLFTVPDEILPGAEKHSLSSEESAVIWSMSLSIPNRDTRQQHYTEYMIRTAYFMLKCDLPFSISVFRPHANEDHAK